jgi:2-keto-4-pentenoate hydratase
MNELDPRLKSALALQLGDWRATLRDGAERVGWKLGIGSSERIGGQLVVGHLTSATRLEDGATYRAADAVNLHADAEVALELGRDDAVTGFGAALELVDLGDSPGDPEGIVATNVFHRAFVLGPFHPALPTGSVEVGLVVNGDVRASARAPDDFTDRICAAGRLLGAMGERLRAGDRIITGNVVQVAVAPGDEVIADFGELGRLRLEIAS